MFKFNEITFVPAHRQVTAYFSEQDARAEQRPAAIFTQLENTSTEFEITVGKTVLKLDGDYPHVKPTPDVLKQWLACIEDHIDSYLKGGVIVPVKTRGDINIDHQDGTWFMTRGNESITLNNRQYLPAADCDYWVGYVTQCAQCQEEKTFEFVGVDASVLTVPEGVLLADHLRPFIQAMETDIGEMARNSSGRRSDMFWGMANMSDNDANEHIHGVNVLDVVAGKPCITAGGAQDKVGAVELDGQEVMALYRQHVIILGETILCSSGGAYELHPKLVKVLLKRLETACAIDVKYITAGNFSRVVMGNIAQNALRKEFPTGAPLELQQLYTTMRTAAIPSQRNYWLRVLVNLWFIYQGLQYSEKQLHDLLDDQLQEINKELEVDDTLGLAIRSQLHHVVHGWFSE